jgi:hypothetical protein
MSLQQFINENREAIQSYVAHTCPNCSLDDDELRLWILNDEWLYTWAISEGVNL